MAYTIYFPTNQSREQLTRSITEGLRQATPTDARVQVRLSAGDYFITRAEALRIAVDLAATMATANPNVLFHGQDTWGHSVFSMRYETFVARYPSMYQQTYDRIGQLFAEGKIVWGNDAVGTPLKGPQVEDLQSITELAMGNGFTAAVLDQARCELGKGKWHYTIIPDGMGGGANVLLSGDGDDPLHGEIGISLGAQILFAGQKGGERQWIERIVMTVRHERAHMLMNALGRKTASRLPWWIRRWNSHFPYLNAVLHLGSALPLYAKIVSVLPKTDPDLFRFFAWQTEEVCDPVFLYQHAALAPTDAKEHFETGFKRYPAQEAVIKSMLLQQSIQTLMQLAEEIQEARAVGADSTAVNDIERYLRRLVASVAPQYSQLFDDLLEWYAKAQAAARSEEARQLIRQQDPSFRNPFTPCAP